MDTAERAPDEALADLTAVVAALLAGSTDRIYPAHAAGMLDPLARLVDDASLRGDGATATSLRGSLERVARTVPPARR